VLNRSSKFRKRCTPVFGRDSDSHRLRAPVDDRARSSGMSNHRIFARRQLLTTTLQTGTAQLLLSTFGLGCTRAASASIQHRADGAPFSASAPSATATAAGSSAPKCGITASNIEGPFYKAGAPVRTVLAGAADRGERLLLSGRVLSPDCTPIAGARLEFWHANAVGSYDLDGMQFRATQVTDADGLWTLNTVVPGRYLNGAQLRPAHVHAKVHVPGRRSLTTQLYFEGDAENAHDPFIVASLIMQHDRGADGRSAKFDFVIR
jgi:protocatechuate 3,4-dioxygenase beta subunit